MISKLTILDYKCFDNFIIKNLRRINLISGKNDVGKTAFLDYIYWNYPNTVFLNRFYNIEDFKDKVSIILFDEIESGLHYTRYKSFWGKLFKLIEENENIQIFATSHSEEMIEAFAQYCLENNLEDKAMYFEMSKNLKTNKIGATSLEVKSLYKRIQDESGFRGE